MVLVRLAGGLGNQIFQFAAALLIMKSSRCKKIVIDINSLSSYNEKRKNELEEFFDLSKLNIDISYENKIITKMRIPKIASFNISKYPFIGDKNFKNLSVNPNELYSILDGYFQNCLNQENFDYEIYLLKSLLKKKYFTYKEGCVLHIRGGDFLKLGWNCITPKEYYIKAIDTMKNEYQQEKFYIVTDDREYSKTILEKLNIDYKFIGNSMYEDFKLIGSFKYRILSASTFALWASALGINENSIVVAPRYWTPNCERKIYLPNEIRVDF